MRVSPISHLLRELNVCSSQVLRGQKNKGTYSVSFLHTDKTKEDQSWEMFGST